MVQRESWKKRVEALWQSRSLLWLTGVRRVGKSTLCRSLPEIEYFDCELPRVRRMIEDPEAFLGSLRGKRIILDEVHRLENPSELLKIGADHFSEVSILATGSSTLGASAKFKDTLTGRKNELHLTPMTLADMEAFDQPDFSHRFLHGGLPPLFLSPHLPERECQEWIDSYWAKDIQELFRLERRNSFQKFLELLMAQSGGIFVANRFAQQSGVSHTTISNYLRVLESTFVVHVVKPFSSHSRTEIVSAPRVYGFDTGFVCHYRGWRKLRAEDMGGLWEHFVLNEIFANTQSRRVNYWRDKHGHEVDFVLARPGHPPAAIECKWSTQDFNAANILHFRRHYSDGANYVVAPDVSRDFVRRYDTVEVTFVSLKSLIERIMRAR